MLALLLVSSFIQLSLISAQSEEGEGEAEEYAYKDEDLVAETKTNDGDRLVGGKLSSTRKFPFAIGWNIYGLKHQTSCTGSLITPNWFVSAAHCNELMTTGSSERRDRTPEIREECVKATKRGGSYPVQVRAMGTTFQLQCRWQRSKRKGMSAFEIIFSKQAWAWLGVNNFNDKGANPGSERREIRRHLRHEHSYRGGGSYGNYGGHDITLVELTEAASTKFPQACLPSPSFNDIRDKDDSILVGYGKYLRRAGKTCETNRFGQMKFHYCDKDGGDGSEACVKDTPPPIAKECAKFFDDLDTPDTVPSGVEEIRLVIPGKKDVLCNPPTNPVDEAYGWCKTRGDYYSMDNWKAVHNGWGYCGADCYNDQKEDVMDSGMIRTKSNIHILSEKLCDKYLALTLEDNRAKVRPEILCVAQQHRWKEEAWQVTGKGYRKLEQEAPPRYGHPWYVASVGTCQGDSGGPVFVDEDDHFVVTGVVSGGRGQLGDCGGINNPIHYVRVKRFTRWIVENVGASERNKICWNKAFQARLEETRRKRRG